MTIDQLINRLKALTYETPATYVDDVYFVDADGVAFNLDRVVYNDEEGDVRITSIES